MNYLSRDCDLEPDEGHREFSNPILEYGRHLRHRDPLSDGLRIRNGRTARAKNETLQTLISYPEVVIPASSAINGEIPERCTPTVRILVSTDQLTGKLKRQTEFPVKTYEGEQDIRENDRKHVAKLLIEIKTSQREKTSL